MCQSLPLNSKPDSTHLPVSLCKSIKLQGKWNKFPYLGSKQTSEEYLGDNLLCSCLVGLVVMFNQMPNFGSLFDCYDWRQGGQGP